MNLLRLNLIPDIQQIAFDKRLKEIAAALLVNPNWLMQVMYSESRLRANNINPISKATGLIQFMPATAKGLGTTVEQLRTMNAVQQLDYVYKYFLPYKGKMKSYYDVYAVVFFPAMIGKADSWVLQAKNLSPGIIAKQNPVVNINKDGQITVAEFKQYVFKSVEKTHREIVFGVLKAAATAAGAGGAIAVVVLLFFCSVMTNI